MRAAAAAALALAALAACVAGEGRTPPLAAILEDADAAQRDATALLQRAVALGKSLPAASLVDQLLSQREPRQFSAEASAFSRELAAQQAQQDAEVRRQDAGLRATNGELRKELQEQVAMLASREEERQRIANLRQRLLQPLPLTLMVAGLCFLLYWGCFVWHVYAFHRRREQIRMENYKIPFAMREPEVTDEDFEEQTKQTFLCGMRRSTVRSLLCLLVAVTGSASYLAQQGFFLAVQAKIVPQAYFVFVGILLFYVAIGFVVDRVSQHFKRFLKVTEKLSASYEAFEAVGMARLV
eukprot:TRINITY_DN47212_c0_g1_i1.p1 TRINITY_DN47212_c0_g1~~TRINITY_DN47212_c0_g1_i1.p1  ORF type:complete len:322 (-),score=76.99 TRINITY_DN47212_c0_g1_i1:47-937(-)